MQLVIFLAKNKSSCQKKIKKKIYKLYCSSRKDFVAQQFSRSCLLLRSAFLKILENLENCGFKK